MSTTESFQCLVPGCTKAFKRHEHLLRHEKIHNPLNVYICPVCEKKFNRKDSLNRHVVLHSDGSGTAALKKVKRACETCRKAKTKCDGEEHCQICVKKGVDCVYIDENVDQHETLTESAIPSGSALDYNLAAGFSSLNHDSNSPPSPPGKALTGAGLSVVQPGSLPSLFQSIPLKSLPSPLPPTHNHIDWGKMTIEKDCSNITEHEPEATFRYPGTDTYLAFYFEHFHRHWPVFHRIMGQDLPDHNILILTVKMIGGWLVGTEVSNRFARVTFEDLMQSLFPRLNAVTSEDRFQGTLSANYCDAVLLNIVFALYLGERKAISRASALLNSLVSALRQVRFFDESVTYRDQQPGFFPPMSSGLLGQRNRLAFSLYKVDAYLSVLTGQPSSISVEELHFPPPSTFALFNCNGLDVWDERQRIEPLHRHDMSMFAIAESLLSDNRTSSFVVMIEDIDLSLSALYAQIWKLNQHKRILSHMSSELCLEHNRLTLKLDRLKHNLETIVNQPAGGSGIFGDEPLLPLRFYFGFNIPSDADAKSKNEVVKHVKSLIFATLLHCHTLSLHLVADITLLGRFAKDQSDSLDGVVEPQRSSRIHRALLVKKWATIPAARRALCYAVDILVAHGSVRTSIDSETTIHQSLTPITHIAIVFAALVIWVYCVAHQGGCLSCVPGGSEEVVDLTTWSNMGFETHKDERNAWIDIGDMFRPQIHGLQLCRCNVEFFVGLFKQMLPPGWDGGHLVFGELWKNFA